ncbi:hypothetical protein [Mycobacterium talmoniae]|uniref:Uncharacterized protein n=1 Tax=Mycobacterium talmoniae TaxID=1858794 RepID=A0A1S1NEP6_9MYCO|nr:MULTISPECIES: hypothetical protein [Mycobacterium]OHU98311.1 hypothetical protein BKN37_20870 [Mycobacterium talmoniae]PQM47585.1 hypothetical protein C1Y40_02202 [Mycobacterium talmoniae]
MIKTIRLVRGIELRYLLTLHLFDHGPASVAVLVAALDAQGFVVAGRASKAVSDALRWERGYGRVRRFGRGRYGPGWMPRGTEHRIRSLPLSLTAGQPPTSDNPRRPGPVGRQRRK